MLPDTAGDDSISFDKPAIFTVLYCHTSAPVVALNASRSPDWLPTYTSDTPSVALKTTAGELYAMVPPVFADQCSLYDVDALRMVSAETLVWLSSCICSRPVLEPGRNRLHRLRETLRGHSRDADHSCEERDHRQRRPAAHGAPNNRIGHRDTARGASAIAMSLTSQPLESWLRPHRSPRPPFPSLFFSLHPRAPGRWWRRRPNNDPAPFRSGSHR